MSGRLTESALRRRREAAGTPLLQFARKQSHGSNAARAST